MGHATLRRPLYAALVIALLAGAAWPPGRASAATGDGNVGTAPVIHPQHETFTGAGMGGPARPTRVRAAYVSGAMTYHGGPVLHSSRVHAFFWDPSGVAFSSDYVNKIVRYFNDVSADSLSRTNV